MRTILLNCFEFGTSEEQFCEIILNLDQWFKDTSYLDTCAKND